MPRRNRHRIGRHLVTDDESGIVYYDDEVQVVWDGTVRKHYEDRQPQEFVKAGGDPYPAQPVRPAPDMSLAGPWAPVTVGKSCVPAPTGAATHLFDKAIPNMRVGRDFIVRGPCFSQISGTEFTIVDENGNPVGGWNGS